MDKVNIREKLARFDARWQPKIIGELNGRHGQHRQRRRRADGC